MPILIAEFLRASYDPVLRPTGVGALEPEVGLGSQVPVDGRVDQFACNASLLGMFRSPRPFAMLSAL